MSGFDEFLDEFKRKWVPRCRIDLLQHLPAGALAEYLARELDDGVPVNWPDWLAEEV